MPLVVFAGREYGTGSSRDWAAKGTRLLGVRAVIAQSFERIHRSNLVGMGVLPLTFEDGASWQSLGLKGEETVSIAGLARHHAALTLTARIIRGGRHVSRPFRCFAASIPKTNSTTSAMAAFCHSCYVVWQPPETGDQAQQREITRACCQPKVTGAPGGQP